MSHFLNVRTTLKVQTILTAGLKAMGFEVEAVTLTPGLSAKDLDRLAITYQNSFRQHQKAHVVARHAELRAKATAIGFRWDATEQVFVLQCDPYEIRNSDYGRQCGRVVGDAEGKPVVEALYCHMDDQNVLTVLQQQLQVEYDRALVYSTYNVHSETYVGTEIQFEATPKVTAVGISTAVQRV